MTRGIKKFTQSEYFIPFLIFLVTVLLRSINLFGYPYFENDEGVYTSQGWWLINFGKLAPYTYWYDHSPFGWLLIGLWQKLTGGPFTFGFSIFSIRIFMTLIAGLVNVFVYRLILLLTKNKKSAIFGCLVLAISPLAITYQRRILLDNLEIFWFLISLWFLFKAKSRLSFLWLSGIFFGFSVLSKESAIFLLPVMLYGVWLKSSKENRRFGILVWFLTTTFIIGLFPLLALIKGEFFPTGWFDNQQHVSLIETIKFQMGRGTERKAWEEGSIFRIQLNSWFKGDFLIMALGFWSILVNLFFYWKHKNKRLIILSTIFYFLFLARGGLVLDFYIIPLLILFSLNIGLSFNLIEQKFLKKNPKTIIILLICFFFIFQKPEIYTSKPTKKQLEAVSYIQKNLDSQDFIVIDNFAFTDFRLSKKEDDKKFFNTEWFWKVETDPEIREGKLKNEWQNIDYILLSGEMRRKLTAGEFPFLKQAFDNAVLIKDFPSDNEEEQGKVETLEREGDGWAALFKIKKEENNEEKIVNKLIENMSLEQKVGQLFMIGFDGTKLSEEMENLLAENYFGGFFVNSKNIENKEQLNELITNIKQKFCLKITNFKPEDFTKNNIENQAIICLKPFVSIDQEGGVVNRINFENFDNTSQSEMENENQAFEIAKKRAEDLKGLGFNINFSPVLEVVKNNFSFINRSGRAFVGNKEKVYKLGKAMIDGYQIGGIIPAAKHFPADLGQVLEDPHLQLPKLEIKKSELINNSYVFNKIIQNGAPPIIMTTHILYPNIDKKYPSSLSEKLTRDILRGDFNYEGIIISDDLAMAAIKNNYSVTEAAKQAFLAGNDLILISGDQTDYQTAVESFLQAIKSGEISESRVDESLKRILKLKSRE